MVITIYFRCFPHVVNLAVQAVLSSITNMNFEEEDNFGFPKWSASCDIIAVLQTLINKVYNLSFFF